ncbi:MAG: hypothetical protein R3B13_07425 [Polyangiaceae bacterium]
MKHTLGSKETWRRMLGAAAVGATLSTAAALPGCRTSSDDIERWTNTAQGPRKLVAVISHDKYPHEMRVEAAMALVRMKPRNGRAIGLLGQDDQIGLLAALEALAPAEREKIITDMVPKLEEAMKAEPPKAQAGQPTPPDPSFPFKDAAFALLTHAEGSLFQSEELRTRLRAALTAWCNVNFAERLDDSSQLYGMDQVLRELGAQGVAGLADQIEPNAKKIEKMADLVAELGNDAAKLNASKRLVAVAQEIDSDKWIQQKSPLVDAANKASKLNPSADQFKAQLDQYQEEELLRIFSSMKKVGGAPIVEYLLSYGKDSKKPEKRRASALANLEGNIDKNNQAQITDILQLASGKDTPDTLRDVALRRVGELPRKQVASQLFGLFNNDNWKIRWVAAELVLKMGDTSNVDEFMRKIAGARGMAITEPLRYGAIIGELKGTKKPADIVDTYMRGGWSVEARMSALGYYYEHGTKEQLSKVTPYQNDRTRAPRCLDDASDCEWKCAVGEGASQELKDVTTLGEFVSYCVKPAMEKRSADKTTKK